MVARFSVGLFIRYAERDGEVLFSRWTEDDMNRTLKGSWDIFLSHASEDKADFVEPLADELRERDLHIWYDDSSLPIGCSIRQGIDEGLLSSRFTAVILSSHYISKEWTKKELDALFALEGDGVLRIIPIYHQISAKDVRAFSPLLAAKKPIDSAIGRERVVDEILKIISEKEGQAPTELYEMAKSYEMANDPSQCLHVVLAGCGWWARNKTVLPFVATNPRAIKIEAITWIKNGKTELERDVLPAFDNHNIPHPEYLPELNLVRAIRKCRDKAPKDASIAVIINTPNQFHDQLADEALDKGCHVYAERPINRVSEPLRDILSLADTHNLILYNGVQRRLEATFRYLANAIEHKHYFGTLSSIRCILSGGRQVEGWRCNRELSGGGIVIDEGYHLLDAATWLLEFANPGISFSSKDLEASALFKYGETGSSIEVETSAIGFVRFPNDVDVSFDLSYNTPIKSVFEMIEIRDVRGNMIRLIRDLRVRTPEPGRIIHQLRDGTLVGEGYVRMDSGNNFTFVSSREDASGARNIGPLSQFVNRIMSGNALNKQTARIVGVNECEGRFVLNTQEVVSAIYRSEERTNRITIA